jgi:hypothetical protein
MSRSADLEFAWSRPKKAGGFQVEMRQTEGGPAAQKTLVLDLNAPVEPYHPLESPVALYLELANCAPTVGGVLAFANRYGYLGLHRDSGGPCKAETVAEWALEIAWLREAVEVWGLWKKKDVEKLRARVRREGDVVQYRAPPGVLEALGSSTREDAVHDDRHENAASGTTASAKRKRIPEADVLSMALLILHQLVNRRLAASGTFKMFEAANGKRSGVAYVPNSLLGAIYLRFALAVSSRTRTRKCNTCGRHFELAPGKARADRIFCSDACKSKAYRRRQEKARRLRARGERVEGIAQKVEVDVETVQRWIDLAKGE